MRYAAVIFILLAIAATAMADTVEEYTQKLKSARDIAASAGENPALAEDVADILIELEEVEIALGNGESIKVSNYWVHDAMDKLAGDDPEAAARNVRDKLEAVMAQIEGMETAETRDLDVELATGEEFAEGVKKPTLSDQDLGIRKQLRKLADMLKSDRERERQPIMVQQESSGSAGLFTIMVIIIVCIVLFMIAYQVAKNRTSRPPLSPKLSAVRAGSVLEDALKRTPEEWKILAREYFDKGDFTNAVRALYLSLLVIMHRKRLISYDQSKTNWEYVWEINPQRTEFEPFRILTLAFDHIWYGREQCTREEFLKLEKMADKAVEYREVQA